MNSPSMIYREATKQQLEEVRDACLAELRRREKGGIISIKGLVEQHKRAMQNINMITPETMRSLVKHELKLADLPMDLEFAKAGFTNANFQRIQQALNKAYNKTVATILYAETIYTLTDRFNGSNIGR